MKRYSKSLVIREIQIKNIMKNHLPDVKMSSIKKTGITSAGKDMGKREILDTVGRNVNRYSHYRKQ